MIKEREIYEECGLVGVYGITDGSEILYYGLHSLQHRGQQACGIVTFDQKRFSIIKDEGLIIETFSETNLKTLTGTMGIGHVKYDNASHVGKENIQPFIFHHHTGDFAIAHNGSIVNSKEIRKMLEDNGSLFQSDSDAEIFAHLLIRNKNTDMEQAIIDSLRQIEGGFALLIMTENAVYACRDKHGLRPLSLGKLNGGYVIASETCAFEVIGADFLRDLIPGEVLQISSNGLSQRKYSNYSHHYLCAMEYAYFARPDSDLEGLNVHTFRRNSGKMLARQHPADADIVVGVPDSSLSAAMGYAEESQLPFETGLIKNRYIGRTFIQPVQSQREKAVKLKLSAIPSVVKGKRIVLIDDSIVRGTTCRRIVTMLKESGATEVHVRIATPQITHPCIYGVDFTTYQEIIGASNSKEEIRKAIGADSLEYLQLQSLYEIAGRKEMCTSCFTGNYPTNLYQSIKNKEKKG